MSAVELVPPLAPAWKPGRHGAVNGAEPVVISRRAVEMVQLTARAAARPSTAGALQSIAGVAWPEPGQASAGSAGAAAIWLDPDSCLLTRSWISEGGLYREVRQGAPDCAVVDQSHGKSVLRIAGVNAPAVLAKGCRIDLHPRVFGSGGTAVTPIARINCVLHQVDAVPTFDLILPATLARAFLEWLEMSAAEFGYVLQEEP